MAIQGLPKLRLGHSAFANSGVNIRLGQYSFCPYDTQPNLNLVNPSRITFDSALSVSRFSECYSFSLFYCDVFPMMKITFVSLETVSL